MAGQNNLDRPGGLDEKQFADKFNSRIAREGKYQTKVSRLAPRCCAQSAVPTGGPQSHADRPRARLAVSTAGRFRRARH